MLIIFSNKKATTFCDRNFLCLYYNTDRFENPSKHAR
nr:MAG TPA: hypothetical protein [Caudoviricetes sp.]